LKNDGMLELDLELLDFLVYIQKFTPNPIFFYT